MMETRDKENTDPKGIARLYELTRAILLVNDPEELLNTIASEVVKLFHARGSIIRVAHEGKLYLKASCNLPESFMADEAIAFGEGLAGMAVSEDRTIIYQRGEDPYRPAVMLDIQNAVSTPLKSVSNLLGTFTVFDKTDGEGNIVPFTKEDVDSLEGFATIAAIVIEKLFLYEKALQKEREANEEKQRALELSKYLQSLIDNTADAIITTDLNRTIQSWNIGAENMYGYTREEAVGKSYLLIPDFMLDIERVYTEGVKKGETLKNLETVHRKKDGSLIDVSLTMSPIKDIQGNIIGISGISRDITHRKKTERELIRKNDMLNRLIFISSAMRSTLNLDRLLRMILTAVTMGDGFGFNRAMLFLLDEERNVLKGAMGVGPSGHEEAWRIWSTLSMENKNLNDLIEEIERGPLKKDSFMDKLCCSMEIPLDEVSVLTMSLKNKIPYNVKDVHLQEFADPLFMQHLGSTAYAVIPLVSQGKAIGVLWVDNHFSRRPITDDDIEYLKGFTSQIASAIENARLFERVYQAEKELENIFESIDDMLYVTDVDYVIRNVNRAVTEKLGMSAKDIIGKKSFEVFHHVFAECETRFREMVNNTDEPFIEEIEDKNSDNTYLISCSPIINSVGKPIGTVHIVRDVTEIKKLRARVHESERMAALGEIAAKVAHEIRNPLLSIGGFARRLEKRLNGGLSDYAKIIVEEVRRLEQILNDTLSFAKSSRIERTELDLCKIIESVTDLLEPVILENKNRLIKDLKPLHVCVSPDRFREALMNIINNANQFTSEGNITISIDKRTINVIDTTGKLTKRNEAVISISDTGCGIKKEDMPRIFDPFFTTRTNGTGLGLAITKRIIEEHGGMIEVHSTTGEGTTFKIYLTCKEDEQ
jgi:PAS domain S-box-containing protein